MQHLSPSLSLSLSLSLSPSPSLSLSLSLGYGGDEVVDADGDVEDDHHGDEELGAPRPAEVLPPPPRTRAPLEGKKDAVAAQAAPVSLRQDKWRL